MTPQSLKKNVGGGLTFYRSTFCYFESRFPVLFSLPKYRHGSNDANVEYKIERKSTRKHCESIYSKHKTMICVENSLRLVVSSDVTGLF